MSRRAGISAYSTLLTSVADYTGPRSHPRSHAPIRIVSVAHRVVLGPSNHLESGTRSTVRVILPARCIFRTVSAPGPASARHAGLRVGGRSTSRQNLRTVAFVKLHLLYLQDFLTPDH